jgi:hypothetical protein
MESPMKYALTLEPRPGHSENTALRRKDTHPGRPAHRREGHLRVVKRDVDASTRRGSEHTDPTFVPSLAFRGGSPPGAFPDAFEDEAPTTVREFGASIGDARQIRRERSEFRNETSSAAIVSRAEQERWFENDEGAKSDESDEVTDVTGPPGAAWPRNVPVFVSPSVQGLSPGAPRPGRLADQPSPTVAGSFIAVSFKDSRPEPAPRPMAPPAPGPAAAPVLLPLISPPEPAPAAPVGANAGASQAHAAPAPRRKAPAKRRSISMGFTLGMFLLVCGVLFLHGWDFYVLELDSRIEHPAYDALRPSGSHGYGYGVSGTVLIFLNLLYLARRRLARLNLGSMRTWLDLHVFTGVVGAGFIIFHSAFQLRSPLAVTTAVGFAVVMVTGFVGRFLYALVPRSDQNLLSAAIARLEGLLPGIAPHVEHAVRAFPIRDLGGTPGLLRALAALPGWRRTARHRRQAIRFVAESAPAMSWMDGKGARDVRAASRQVERAAALEVRGEAAATLLSSWRSLHRFFALLMLMCVIVHVTMALRYGYHWIFST